MTHEKVKDTKRPAYQRVVGWMSKTAVGLHRCYT